MPYTFWNARTSQPVLNIKETDDNFEIGLAAPGFGKKDFNVTIEDGFLNIFAEKKVRKKKKKATLPLGNSATTRSSGRFNSGPNRVVLT